jgi:fatty-acyl-CoA synthase
MAAVVMRDGPRVRPAGFLGAAAQRLPKLRGAAVRARGRAADMTTTFKLRKVDLQREGFDTSEVRSALRARREGRRTMCR